MIFEENGVTIRSWPAIHSIDGPVSFSLEWNGLKFVYGSDTYPNKWFLKYALDADIAIHECFVAVPDIVSKLGFTPESALKVGTQIHTAPEAFGKVMSEIKPRMAVVEEATWSPPLASEAIAPELSDRDEISKRLNWEVGYSDFISGGKWKDVDEVLKPIYEEAGKATGKTYAYPEE